MMPIVGKRYHSLTKEDFDLCETCEAKGLSQGHDMICYDTPVRFARNGPKHRGPRFGGPCRRDPHGFGTFDQFIPDFKGCPMFRQCPQKELNKSQLQYKAKFVKDLSIPDGSEFKAGEPFTKTWMVVNSGVNPWPVNTCLWKVSGDDMGCEQYTPIKPELYGKQSPAQPKEVVEVSLDLVAPARPGQHYTVWRLGEVAKGDDGAWIPGKRFGQKIWVDMKVKPADKAEKQVQPEMKAPEAKPAEEKRSETATPEPVKEEPSLLDEVDGVFHSILGSGFAALNELQKQEVLQKMLDESSKVMDEAKKAAEPVLEQAKKVAEPVLEEAKKAAEPVLNEANNFASSIKTAVMQDGSEDSSDEEEEVEVEIVKAEVKKEASDVSLDFNDDDDFSVVSTDDGCAYPTIDSTAESEPTAADLPEGMDQLLEAGFNDLELNKWLLEEKKGDVAAVMNQLVESSDWDGMLQDLLTMGFSEFEKNRRLLFKHSGNITATIKELLEEDRKK